MSDKKQKVSRAARKLDRVLELPAGALSGGAHIEINSNREVVIDGCRGIIDYSEESVRINVGNGSVTFSGKNLMIKTLTDKEAVIAGCISAVEFDC